MIKPCPVDGEATECRDCGAPMVMRGFGVPTCEACLEKGEREGRYFRGVGSKPLNPNEEKLLSEGMARGSYDDGKPA